MDKNHPSLDNLLMVFLRYGESIGGMVGLQGSWMGGILGMGPCRKCLFHAMAYRHSISPFCHDSGKEWYAQGMEYGSYRNDILPYNLRNLSYKKRDCSVCPLLW